MMERAANGPPKLKMVGASAPHWLGVSLVVTLQPCAETGPVEPDEGN